jgi:hypothetical protein
VYDASREERGLTDLHRGFLFALADPTVAFDGNEQLPGAGLVRPDLPAGLDPKDANVCLSLAEGDAGCLRTTGVVPGDFDPVERRYVDYLYGAFLLSCCRKRDRRAETASAPDTKPRGQP